MSTDSTDQVPRPRVRWGAIAWGVIASAIVVATLSLAGSPTRRDSFAGWLFALSPGAIIVLVAIAIGAILLLLGILAALRKTDSRPPATDRTPKDRATQESVPPPE
ncbi:MAG: hypothetical protein QOI70_1695 [Microbacteriaceae bacterium]|nr:hypothetical protein [Microbacteriaceae bacterium]